MLSAPSLPWQFEPSPWPPRVGPVLGVITKLQQGVHVGVAGKNDVAPAPAIATAGSAARNEFLPPKRHTAVSPSAGGHVNFGFVNEHAGDR